MILVFVLAARAADPVSVSYADALARASASASGVALAQTDHAAALGALLVARAPFEPMLSLGGTTFASTDEGQAQFGAYTSDTTGYTINAGLTQAFATGTGLSLDFDADQSDSTFTIEQFDAEFGEPAWGSKLTLGLSQSLLQGHRLAWNLRGVHAAQGAVSSAELALEIARQDAVAAAARGYWGLHTARRLVEIAAQSRAATAEQARITRALVGAGKLAQVEATRIAAALAQAERATLDAEAAAEAAEDQLAVLIGVSLEASLTLSSRPAPPIDVTGDDRAILDAVAQGNPSLRLARLEVDTRTQDVRDARHGLLPQLDANGGVALRGYDPTLSGSLAEIGDAKLPQWSVGATLTMPLLNRLDRGSLAQSHAALARAKLSLAAAEATVETAARAQLRSLDGARQLLELAELNQRLAEETFAAEKARLVEGRSLQRDLITAQKDVDQARADAEKARTDWLVALVELERLRGAL
ncbi:MAG: TolC family protein [Myxococcales bacterium]|nr:TolC family protein [Myxococcales bacterium]